MGKKAAEAPALAPLAREMFTAGVMLYAILGWPLLNASVHRQRHLSNHVERIARERDDNPTR